MPSISKLTADLRACQNNLHRWQAHARDNVDLADERLAHLQALSVAALDACKAGGSAESLKALRATLISHGVIFVPDCLACDDEAPNCKRCDGNGCTLDGTDDEKGCIDCGGSGEGECQECADGCRENEHQIEQLKLTIYLLQERLTHAVEGLVLCSREGSETATALLSQVVARRDASEVPAILASALAVVSDIDDIDALVNLEDRLAAVGFEVAEDEDDKDDHCHTCNGSGEGMADGTVCRDCRGQGVVRADDGGEP